MINKDKAPEALEKYFRTKLLSNFSYLLINDKTWTSDSYNIIKHYVGPVVKI